MRLRERILRLIARTACNHSWAVLGVFLLVTAFSVAVIAVRGKVSTDLTDVLPTKSEECALYVEAAETFASDFLLVVLEADDPKDIDRAKPFVDRLAARLAYPDYAEFVKSVEYKIGEEVRRFVKELAEERGYLYLDAEDRRLIARKLTTETIAKQMAANRAKLDAAGIDFFEKRIIPDPLNFFEVLKRHRASAGGGFVPKEGESYLISPDGTLLLIVVQGAEPVRDTSFNERFMAAIERAEAETWDELVTGPGTESGGDAAVWKGLRERVRVRHAGAYAIAVDQNRMLVSDLGKSFVMSLVCVMAIFALGFRRLGALFYIGFPLIASVTWTLAAAFLAFGHISMMSGGFAAILVGLSVDFAIHIYNRYVTERAEGAETPKAIEGALAATGSGIFFGAVTSSVAFFGVMLTRFVGLSEFGFLAGIGVLFGMTTMFFVLPALLYVRNTISEEPTKLTRIYGFHLGKVAGAIDRRPGIVFGVSASLAVAAAVFVYTTMTVYFFDSDLKNLRAESPVIDLAARIQRKFGTNLAKMIVLSRGATEEDVLEKAGEVLARAERIVEGSVVERAPWPEGAPASGRPFIRVDGCIARVRRAEIVLPKGVDPPSPRAESTVLMTQPDGSRLLVYPFDSRRELADWEFEGDATYMGGAELRPASDGTGAVMRWKHEVRAPAEIVFSVRYLGKARRVTLGLAAGAGEGVEVAAGVEDAPEKPTGSPWPPAVEDQVRMTLTAGPESGIELAAGRGTVTGVDSVARFVPPLSRQKASAAFVAGIDVDRVEEDIGRSARANGINPEAFEEFVERLRDMAERAREAKYLTLAEITATKFGAALKKYYAAPRPAPEAGAVGPGGAATGPVHTIATFLYPERGEQPREWFQRVDLGVGEGGDLTAPRLISLEIRDIVHQDFSWLTILVFAGVALVLLWTFGSPAQSAIGLILMLAVAGLELAFKTPWVTGLGGLAAVAVLVICFRSVAWSAAALGPVFASFALMLATMLLVRHRLNFLNVLVFPILVGIGIDYGIHVVHRFRQAVPVRDIVTETGRAFVLTSLTTIAGFGSLVISSYKGLSSFGFVTILGMSFVLLTSLIALPSGLRLVERRRAAKAEGAGAGQGGEEEEKKTEGGAT